ncbi:hypothetical protein [uncultured Dubosiella sp.]|uniref:hypothetical protein n=1 Tax=uncultured Dubosiella sp. TaxID=1937011 RepID=UPI0025E10C44|nr:hypothetical protein [uncultured Dubosiella sp.]
MKKTTLVGIVLLSGCIIIPVTHAMASEKDPEQQGKEAYVQNVFSTMADDEKVLQMPSGGFLSGEATVIKADGTTIEYNSETDPGAMTVAEAKEALQIQLESGTLPTE